MNELGAGLGVPLALVLGAVFGSFATAAIYRLPRGIPIGLTRSRCPSCGQALTPRDLVPVLSWLLSLGRCRHCGVSVSGLYPLIELLSAFLFLSAWLNAPGPAAALLLALFSLALLVESVIDLQFGILPDKVQVILLPTGIGYRWLTDWAPLDMAAGFALGLATSLILKYGFLRLTGRDGLGWGDVKLIAIAGAVLGTQGIVSFFIYAGLFGLVLGLGWRKWRGPGAFPFGPALAAALYLGVLII